jgi:hypothetical protein
VSLREILRRLERLENHCKIGQDTDTRDVSRSMSVSSGDSDRYYSRSSTGPELVNKGQSRIPNTQDVVHSMLNGIKDDKDKLLLTSNVFCLLQHVQSQVYKNETCIKAIEVAMSEISRLQHKQGRGDSIPPQISKEQAERWVNCALSSVTISY